MDNANVYVFARLDWQEVYCSLHVRTWDHDILKKTEPILMKIGTTDN